MVSNEAALRESEDLIIEPLKFFIIFARRGSWHPSWWPIPVFIIHWSMFTVEPNVGQGGL